MREQRGFNPDADPQQRIEQIRNAFEQQEYERGVQEFTEAVRQLSRSEGRQDAALELAQEIEAYRSQVQDSHPELVNTLDTKIAEAYLYAGESGNDNLASAEERYTRVAATELVEVPEDGSPIPEAERAKYSEVFHALDRLGDVAFAAGQYEDAGKHYANAIKKRAPFDDEPNEQGPLACATYGAAASAFMQGRPSECLERTAVAKDLLTGIEGEDELLTNITNLEAAAEALDELDEEARAQRLTAMNEILIRRGGSGGGVKHTNFREIFDAAAVEGEEATN